VFIDDLLLVPPEEPDYVLEALAGIDRHVIAEIVLEVVAADRLDPFDDDLLTEIARERLVHVVGFFRRVEQQVVDDLAANDQILLAAAGA